MSGMDYGPLQQAFNELLEKKVVEKSSHPNAKSGVLTHNRHCEHGHKDMHYCHMYTAQQASLCSMHSVAMLGLQ